MKYWIIPALVCAGAAQAHAGGFLGASINNPIINLKAGVSAGPSNNSTTTQNGFVNAYAVGNIAAGSNPSNNTTVKQKGFANAAASESIAIGNGKPHSQLSNDTAVYQKGVVDYAYVGQQIPSSPILPPSGP